MIIRKLVQGYNSPTKSEIHKMDFFVKETDFEEFLGEYEHTLLIMMNRVYKRNEKRSDL